MSHAGPTPSWDWAATGTRWSIHHEGQVARAHAEAVAALVEGDEARWSRFRPASEVSAVNAAAGRPVPVSDGTLDLLEACCSWRARTGGAFDPLVGRPLVAWGYAGAAPGAAASPMGEPVSGSISIDRAGRSVRIPAGALLDVAGIAKAWIATRAAALLRDIAPGGRSLLDAGGDLTATAGAHVVAVEDPPGGGPAAEPVHVELVEGEAIATSGWALRSWCNGDGVAAHHLIDPATGRPGPRAHASVIADDLVTADVLAKVLSLRPAAIDAMELPARLSVDGHGRETPAWRRRTGARPRDQVGCGTIRM